MWSFLTSTIERVWPQVRRGIAFNVMSKVVDWERDDLFHVPMDDLARLLHRLSGRNVRFRADYGLYEYTAYAYRSRPAAAQPLSLEKPDSALIPETVTVMRPRLPSVERLSPYLQRMDAARIYSNWGPLARELEHRLSAALSLPEGAVVSSSSGTAALIGAILAKAGRATAARPLALVPSFTFVATAIAGEQCGYQAFLSDIDPQTWMLDPEKVINHGALDRIGVVVPVAPFGRPVPQAPWKDFSEKTGIPVVIDGAASFEALREKPDIYLGEVPVAISFHATKSLATAEGGCVASISVSLAAEVTQALNFGFHGTPESRAPGINGKMSEYHAAVGLAELDGWLQKHAALRAVADCYRAKLADAGLGNQFIAAPHVCSSYALFVAHGDVEAEGLKLALARNLIDYRLWYGIGLHRHAYFSNLPRGDSR